MIDPAPLSFSQASALVAATRLELSWVIPHVSREIGEWRARALAMPENPIRDDALASLATKRFHAEGAAMFTALPRRHNARLLRVLVAIEVMWDFLDSVSERPCEQIVRNGTQLHLALSEALDPGGPISDYYRYHPWHDDGGYLVAMVEACREMCRALPSFGQVQELATRQARLAQVCAINHEPLTSSRYAQLQAWTEREYPGKRELPWHELSAAASSSLAVHALLALAAEPDCDKARVAATFAAYSPWVNLSCTMLDSFSDLAEDRAMGNHNYLSHYRSVDVAIARLREVVWHSAHGVRALPRGERHALLATGMVAMYLSQDSACTPEMRPAARSIMRASGRLPALMWPILRIWRRLASA